MTIRLHSSVNGFYSPHNRGALTVLAAVMLCAVVGCSGQRQQAAEQVRAAMDQQKVGEYDDAIKTLNRCILANADFSEAYYVRGTCYAAKADLPHAIADLEMARQTKPTWDRTWWALAAAYRAEGRHEEALECLNEAIRLKPQAADAFYDRACLLRDHRQTEAALADFRKASELDPANANSLIECAGLEFQTNPDQALDTLAAALKVDRHNADTWLQRAMVYESMGDIDRALADVTVACRLKSDSARAWGNRGRLLSQLNRHQEAEDNLVQAQKLAPGDTGVAQYLTAARQAIAKATQKPAENAVAAITPDPVTERSTRASAISMPEVLQDSSTNGSDFESFPLTDDEVTSASPNEVTETQLPDGDDFALLPLGDEPAEAFMPAADPTTDEANSVSTPFLNPGDAVEAMDDTADDANPFFIAATDPPEISSESDAVEAAVEQAEVMLPPINSDETVATEIPRTNPFVIPSPAEEHPVAVDVTATDVTPEAPSKLQIPEADQEFETAGVAKVDSMPLQDSAPREPAIDIDAVFERAMKNYRNGDRPGSIAAFEMILRADPNHHEARFRYANLLAETGDPEQALIVCTPLVQSDKDNPEYALFRARLLTELKSYPEATAEYTRLLSLGAHQEQALTARAKIALKTRQWDAAVEDLNELIRENPNDIVLLRQRAQTQEQLRQWPLAVADWTQVGLLDNTDVDAMISRADCFLEMGEHKAAIADFTNILVVQPDNTNIATRLAFLHADLGQWQHVQTLLTPILERGEGDAEIQFLRATSTAKQGNVNQAIRDLNDILASDANHMDAIVMRAKLRLNSGEYREAMADLDHALEIYPQDLEVIRLRAATNAAPGDRNPALADLTDLLKQDPQNVDALLARAEVYRLMGDDDQASEDADAILAINAEHYRALVLKGDGMMAQEQFEQALPFYNAALEQDNSDPIVLWNRYQCNRYLGRDVLAAKDLDLIIKRAPTHHEALMARAEMKEQGGMFDSAVEDLSRVLTDHPDDAAAWITRGRIHHRTGKFQEAIHDLDRAVVLLPNEPEGFYRRGLAWHQLDESDKALTDLNAALALESSHADYLYSRGNVHASQGNTKAALRDFETAVVSDPGHAAAWYNHGNAVFGQNRLEDAIESWTNAINIQPGLFRAYNNRAEAMVRLGRIGEAIADYERTLELNPEYHRAYDNYAFLLATVEDKQYRDATQAVSLARKACELTKHENWRYLCTLAASYAEAGDFMSGQEWLTKAHDLAPAEEQPTLAELIKVYEGESAKLRTAKENPAAPRIRL